MMCLFVAPEDEVTTLFQQFIAFRALEQLENNNPGGMSAIRMQLLNVLLDKIYHVDGIGGEIPHLHYAVDSWHTSEKLAAARVKRLEETREHDFYCQWHWSISITPIKDITKRHFLPQLSLVLLLKYSGTPLGYFTYDFDYWY